MARRGTRKKTSRLITWSTEGEPIDEFDVTKEQARDFAEKLREEKRLTERARRKPLERVLRHNAQDNPAWAAATDFIGAAEEGLRFQEYLRSIIERDELTESSRATYLHSLPNHIEGTEFGRRNIAMLDAKDVEDFWHTLDGLGLAARRNVGALMRKAFTRAVRRGPIDVNPMMRADIRIPSKRKRVRGVIVPVCATQPRGMAPGGPSQWLTGRTAMVHVLGAT